MPPVPDFDARRNGSTGNSHALFGWLVMAVLLLAAAVSIAVAATGGGDRLLAVTIGDSVAFDADPGIRAALEATGDVRVESRSYGGIGLLRPGFDGYLAEALLAGPDVVVVMLGGWDQVGILADPEAYGRRLDEVVDRMVDGGAIVIWLGMPPTPPSEHLEAARRAANAQFEALAGRHGQVVYLDSGEALGDPAGGWGFTRFRVGLDGGPVQGRKVRGGITRPSRVVETHPRVQFLQLRHKTAQQGLPATPGGRVVYNSNLHGIRVFLVLLRTWSSGRIIDIDKDMFHTEPLIEPLPQGLHPIAFGGMVTTGKIVHAGFPGKVGGGLGNLAAQVGIHPPGLGLVDKALGATGTPADGFNLIARVPHMQRGTSQHGFRVGGELRRRHGAI